MAEQDRIRVAVVFGGRSGEHDVSCASAAGIITHLNRDRYAVRPVRITSTGSWVPGPEDLPAGPYGPDDLQRLLPDTGVPCWAGLAQALPVLAAADVVLPVLHGPYGEDGTVQGLLETLDVPYVGNGVFAGAAGMDKDVTKRLLASVGLPVAASVLLHGPAAELPEQERQWLGLPAFVKPARAGSSLGVTRVNDWAELDAALAGARAFDTKVLVEEAVLGREVDLAVLEHPDGRLEVGPALEIRVRGGQPFFDYAAKYQDSATRFEIPARLPTRVAERLREMAVEVFRTLGCSGLLRIDFLLRDDTEPVVNEVNTFPGFTAASQYPRIWAATGLAYQELLDVLIATALAGGGPRTAPAAVPAAAR
ncbi:D-alanine--D-alanine ligase family protein [Kitasatospora sp. NBC_01302]|uniref:D-alanine--D-alanine ligase family protein n=1 Tax=Kitasatospora sp. NBC_01302 TaxID=2903575 RepID=UPI002E0FECAA|nr:D-alanine--D-alanine ligase [Kitasatospora sp. NBC_01302]